MDSLYELTYIPVDMDNLEIAFKIQREIWTSDPDYNDLLDKAQNRADNNCSFLVYHDNTLIGITGVDFYKEYEDTIWLDWFAILPEFRRKGYGKKALLDTIRYCKNLKKYDYFRLDTTYYENRPALYLYDDVMDLREDYTIEDTDKVKNNFIIYTYGLNKKAEYWNNKYLGLREYYDNCKEEK